MAEPPSVKQQKDRAYGTVVIAASGTDSTEFVMAGRSAVTIHVPTLTSASLTFKVKVSPDDSLTVLTDKSGDTVTWAASTGAFTRMEPLLSGYYSFQIIASDAQGSARTFYVSANGSNATPVISDIEAVLEGGTVTIVPSQGTLTDRSGTISSGGSAQTLAAINTSRKYLFIENPSQTEDLWINFTTAAVVGQPSILIKPNGSFVMEDSYVSTQLVSVIAATTAHPFTAKEG